MVSPSLTVRRGIIRVCDLVTEQNRFIMTGNWAGSKFYPVDIFELMAVVDAIPLKWRLHTRRNNKI